ncbi:MAG: methyltransferase domain-containing protein [Bacteroidaceae bacterium]|nr:methyltransferase domain-containing protein [Bacteroidaceae bacterium]
MQERHNNRKLYFDELTETCSKYFLPYITRWHKVEAGMKVLEIGCGEGGNLLPFSKAGCDVTGVDIASCRIEEAQRFFIGKQAKGTFIADDVFNLKEPEHKYDIILCHDVMEHLDHKDLFLLRISDYLNKDGIIFMAFPAWQMPFGGHQQICRNKILSHLPFVHLLPGVLYKEIIRLSGESDAYFNELMSIKRTQITIELFEKLVNQTDLMVKDRTLYLVNPHYQVKFGLNPRKLRFPFSSVPYLRNYLSSCCFYILKKANNRDFTR